jgi:DNA-binding response OmpR family regulator
MATMAYPAVGPVGIADMPETLEDFLMTRPPTAERPLLGQTVLAVEDSRYACEALRLICQRSGARIRRADCLKSAERHLQSYLPGIAVIDLGLPDGSGLDLIRRLSTSEPRIGVIMGMSGDDTLGDAVMQAGADTFFAKPITSIRAFQSAILAELPKHARPTSLHPALPDAVIPDRLALRDDLALAFDLLKTAPDARTLRYAASFLSGLAKCTSDTELADCLADLQAEMARTAAAPDTLARLLSLVLNRLGCESRD